MARSSAVWAPAVVISIAAAFGGAEPATAAPRYLGNLPPGTQVPTVPTNPYGNGHASPQLYDSQGRYRGNLSRNPYDPNSASNPYSRFGSPYSPYRQDNPNNPYGPGIGVYRNPP